MPARRSSLGETQCLAPAGGVDDEHLDGLGDGREHALVVARQQRAIDAEGEADARRRRPAQRLDEAVVAAAATERVLRRVERAAGELERGAQVVVEAAHEPGLDDVRDAEGVEAVAHGGEVLGRLLAPEVGDLRRGGDQRGVLRALGVEDAQRVALQRRPALGAELVEPTP